MSSDATFAVACHGCGRTVDAGNLLLSMHLDGGEPSTARRASGDEHSESSGGERRAYECACGAVTVTAVD